MRKLLLILVLLCHSVIAQASVANKAGGIQWVDWTDELFSIAQHENKYVILDLEASWCHWCFMMEDKTYSNPTVINLIKKHYIAVRADQDLRPDLYRRYQKYGWPATIFFAPDGKEIAKRSGYIPHVDMAVLLQAIVDDPTPEPSTIERKITFNESAVLNDKIRSALVRNHLKSYDPKYGSLKIKNKFIDFNTLEYAMLKSLSGDQQNKRMAKHTLDEALALIDPAWGGAYRYSSGGKWDAPHFEKIMKVQGGYLRIYSLAYMQYKDQKYLEAAKNIERYLHNFLTGPNGAFYTSQGAELVKGKQMQEYFDLNAKKRLKLGVPPIDKHQYARENGWAIRSLAALYAASGEKKYLDRANKALKWVLNNRSLEDGGFSHGANDKAGPYLADTLAIGRALISIYSVTGDRDLLKRSEEALQFIDKKFRNQVDGKDSGGFAASYAPLNALILPRPQIDENIALARYAMLVMHYSGKKEYRGIAERVMQYIASPDIALSRITDAGILLVDYEMANDPTHITIVGEKDDVKAQALFNKAVSYPGGYKRIEWWDRREGPMPNPDVQYPKLETAAAFVCSNKRCSMPVFKPEGIHKVANMLNGIDNSSMK